MNIVVVNDRSYVSGGASQVALSSARALARAGHCVILFTAVENPDAVPDLSGVRVVCTRQHEILRDPRRTRAAVQGIWNLRAARGIGRLLSDLDPASTVVHLHSWTSALSASVIRETLVRGFRMVTTLHDYFIACPNGAFFNFPTGRNCDLEPLGAACIRSNCDARSYPQKLWRVGRQFVQGSFGRAPAGMLDFIVVTAFSRSLVERYLPPRSNIYVVPNPIQVERGPPAAVQDHEDAICVGRVAPEKGVALLAQAASGSGVPLLFVGDGPLQHRIQMTNPGARITGWVDADRVQAEMRRARMLVYPSLLRETQGLTVLEAAAVGLPAIVPDGCAARESVVDGVTGLWFRSGDPASLGCKLRILADNPPLAQAMGRAAYDRFWREPPTLERHVEGLVAVYESMLKDSVSRQKAGITEH